MRRRLLGATLVLALGLASAGCGGDPSSGPTPTASGSAPATTAVPSGGVNETTRTLVLSFADSAFATILSRSPTGFDDEIERATALMTPTFAAHFRQTQAAQRQPTIEQRLLIRAKATDSGLVGVDGDRAQVLVFGKETSLRPGRPKQVLRPTVVLDLDLSGASPLVSDLHVAEDPDPVVEQDPDRQTILYRAALVGRALTNVDFRTADANADKVAALSAGPFLRQYTAYRRVLTSGARKDQAVLVSDVVADGISGITPTSASVLVATHGSVTNVGTGAEPVQRDFNLRVLMTHASGEWKAVGLQIVQSG